MDGKTDKLVLGLDGGGIRTLVSLAVLKRLEQRFPGLLDRVDVLAGTSAGAISALMLAAAKDRKAALDYAIEFWQNPALFKSNVARELGALAGFMAFLDNQTMRAALDEVFGDMILSELDCLVAIPAFKLDNESPNPAHRCWMPQVQHNFHGARLLDPDDHFEDWRVADVALRSASLPISVPVYQNYVDGGLFANNPCLATVTQLKWDGIVATLADVRVLSVGVGRNPKYLPEQRADWGYRQWLLDPKDPLLFVQLALEGPDEAISLQCRALLGDAHYLRIDPPLASAESLLAGEPVALLRTGYAVDLSEAIEWIPKHLGLD